MQNYSGIYNVAEENNGCLDPHIPKIKKPLDFRWNAFLFLPCWTKTWKNLILSGRAIFFSSWTRECQHCLCYDRRDKKLRRLSEGHSLKGRKSRNVIREPYQGWLAYSLCRKGNSMRSVPKRVCCQAGWQDGAEGIWRIQAEHSIQCTNTPHSL